ncbi:MAG: zincin-like metallopeptidase domain-containing protein [Pseudomonadota bacterium]
MSNPLEPLLNDIIARLERGVPPWRQPWANGADPSLPLRSDGHPFSGSNAWLLAIAGAERGYTSPYWFTFRQALAIEAPVSKGAKGSVAILYKTRVVDGAEVQSDDGDGGDAKVLRYLKTYAVFNAEQLTDCPERFLKAPKVDPAVRAAARHAVLDAIPAKLEIGGSMAAYFPGPDLIRMPAPEAFQSIDDYLATLAHEAVHWSGGPLRLNRTFGKRFGDSAYAFEELVAELGSAAVGLRIGLRPQLLDSHAAYLAHWVKILKDRPKALLEASGHAQRAIDHLLAYSAADQSALAA